MRVRTWSACVALAWGILLIVTAVGSSAPIRVHPAQANTRIASSTSNTSTTTIQITLTSSVTHTPTSTPTSAPAGRPEAAAAAIARFAPRPRARASTSSRAGTGSYVVQPGDTLSGIASALGTPGGWPALYAANREMIGPDPGLHPPRNRAGFARRRSGGSLHGRRPATPCRASPQRSAPPAAGPRYTRPTAGRSAPTRTRSAPEPCSSSRTRRGRHRTLQARRQRRQGHQPQRGHRRRPRQRMWHQRQPRPVAISSRGWPIGQRRPSRPPRPGCRGGWRSCWWRPGSSSRPRS